MALALLKGVADAVDDGEGGAKTRDRGEAAKAPRPAAAAALSEPCHALITEGGDFAEAERAERRVLELVPRNYRRLARLFAALDLVHRLRGAGRFATQRELYYRAGSDADRGLFRKQAHMDHAIRDAASALRIGRPHLGIFTAEKGLVAGAIGFRSRSGALSNAARGASGAAISEAMLGGGDDSIDVGDARCILVVEKDTFFQHLLQGGLLAVLPLVLVTGRGYPDVLTRRLLQRLHRTAPHLPQVYMGDYDPHGAAIFFLYRASCPWLHWLGLHTADVLKIPAEASVPLEARDEALRQTLLQRPEVRREPRHAAELEAMSRKVELEALHATLGPADVGLHFVPERILRHEWI